MKQRILYYTVMCQSRWSSINRFRVHPSFIYTILSWLLYNILYSFSCVISKDGQSWRISWTKSPLRTVLLLGLPLDSEVLNKKGSIFRFSSQAFHATLWLYLFHRYTRTTSSAAASESRPSFWAQVTWK